MSLQSSERLSKHHLCASGITSRYAPQLLLFAVCFVVGLGLPLLGIQNPQNRALLPGLIGMGASALFLIAPVLGWFCRAPTADGYAESLVWPDASRRHAR